MDYKWLALTVTTIGVLMVGLDTRIVIIGLPQVSEQLGADIEQAIWITQAYVLTNTLMLSLIGRLTKAIIIFVFCILSPYYNMVMAPYGSLVKQA